MKSTAWKPLGRALSDYHAGDSAAEIVVHSDVSEPEALRVSLFFREDAELRPLERVAIEHCRGRVLDAGAGAGAVALLLQERGLSVTALDPLQEAVDVMQERGVRNARVGDLFELPPDLLEAPASGFDTVLLLMNGTGIAGTLAGLPVLLSTVRPLLTEDGQLLIDSADVREDPEDGPPSAGAGEDREDYEGELHYQLEYRGERGDLFPYLFVDADTFRGIATACGWSFERLTGEDSGDYLAVLTP